MTAPNGGVEPLETYLRSVRWFDTGWLLIIFHVMGVTFAAAFMTVTPATLIGADPVVGALLYAAAVIPVIGQRRRCARQYDRFPADIARTRENVWFGFAVAAVLLGTTLGLSLDGIGPHPLGAGLGCVALLALAVMMRIVGTRLDDW